MLDTAYTEPEPQKTMMTFMIVILTVIMIRLAYMISVEILASI